MVCKSSVQSINSMFHVDWVCYRWLGRCRYAPLATRQNKFPEKSIRVNTERVDPVQRNLIVLCLTSRQPVRAEQIPPPYKHPFCLVLFFLFCYSNSPSQGLSTWNHQSNATGFYSNPLGLLWIEIKLTKSVAGFCSSHFTPSGGIISVITIITNHRWPGFVGGIGQISMKTIEQGENYLKTIFSRNCCSKRHYT